MDSSALVMSSQLADGNGTDQDGSPQEARISDLHRLPPELRAMIYEELFFPENQRGERSGVGKNGTILRTCRSIYLEARYTLYRQTLWRITLGNPDHGSPYRSTSTTACLSRRQWSLPFFNFESPKADIYIPLMCKFYVYLKIFSHAEDVRYQIDWLARNVLLKAAQPIKHFVLRIDFEDERLPPRMRSIIFRSSRLRLNTTEKAEGYTKEALEYIKAASAVLGGVLRNVQVARVHIEGDKWFPRGLKDPFVPGMIQAWEERMMSSAEDRPASPLPAMFWAMKDLIKKYEMSDGARHKNHPRAHCGTQMGLLNLRALMAKEEEERFLEFWRRLFGMVRVPKRGDEYRDLYHRILEKYAAHLEMIHEKMAAIEQPPTEQEVATGQGPLSRYRLTESMQRRVNEWSLRRLELRKQ